MKEQPLSLGDMAQVEDITGRNFDDTDQPRGKYLAALVMVLMQRTNPDFTLEDAYKMPATEAGELLEPFLAQDPN